MILPIALQPLSQLNTPSRYIQVSIPSYSIHNVRRSQVNPTSYQLLESLSSSRVPRMYRHCPSTREPDKFLRRLRPKSRYRMTSANDPYNPSQPARAAVISLGYHPPPTCLRRSRLSYPNRPNLAEPLSSGRYLHLSLSHRSSSSYS